MDGGEHLVPGQRRLHGDLRCFSVTNLADEDAVRVVPQDRSQAFGKGESLAFIDRNLQDARQLVLHRVFDRDDLLEAGVDLRQHGIHGRGLAAPGRPRDQQHAVGQGRQRADALCSRITEAQQVQRCRRLPRAKLRLVQQPQHRVFSKDAGHDGHPKVHAALVQREAESAVLWNAAFGDVQLRQHLDPRDHLLRALRVVQASEADHHAVLAQLDTHARAIALKVDVAGSTVVSGT